MPGTTIGRGNVLYDFLVGVTLTPASVGAATSAEQSFTVGGLQTNDVIDVMFNGAQTAGISTGNARVSAANTLTILFSNATAGGVVPASGQYILTVCRGEFPLAQLPTNAY